MHDVQGWKMREIAIHVPIVPNLEWVGLVAGRQPPTCSSWVGPTIQHRRIVALLVLLPPDTVDDVVLLQGLPY